MRTPPVMEFKRHYRKLSEKQTDELVGAVVDLIVNFIKSRKGGGPAGSLGEPATAANTQGATEHGPSEKR
ncbi:MAG: hypothetical protein DRO89_06300 [Candidatus Altiarchaeales archaeon]|nr:MAG: hypothetical protein DRO89_06300 [Candidatus Altiarchaeales archaeon]